MIIDNNSWMIELFESTFLLMLRLSDGDSLFKALLVKDRIIIIYLVQI